MTFRDFLDRMSRIAVPAGALVPELSPEEIYVSCVEDLLLDHPVRTILDLGCGEFPFKRLVHFGDVKYLGLDTHPGLVAWNAAHRAGPNIRFACADFLEADLPPADLLLCRDVLQHLPARAIQRLLRVVPRFRLALFTYPRGSNAERPDLPDGSCYGPLDLLAPPFSVEGTTVAQAAGGKVSVLVRGAGPARTRGFERWFEALGPAPDPVPQVCLALVARQRGPSLPFLLKCVEALDYPASAISLRVRTYNNTDGTGALLADWVRRVGPRYARVVFDDRDVPQAIDDGDPWDPGGLAALARAHQECLDAARDGPCDFLLMADPGHFLRPCALKELVALGLPIAAPFLRHGDPGNPGSNFHSEVDANGYFAPGEAYGWIWSQRVRGVLDVLVVQGTILIRRDALPRLTCDDGTGRHPYVMFSHSARRTGIPQYLDNREVYGLLGAGCEPLLRDEIEAALRNLG